MFDLGGYLETLPGVQSFGEKVQLSRLCKTAEKFHNPVEKGEWAIGNGKGSGCMNPFGNVSSVPCSIQNGRASEPPGMTQTMDACGLGVRPSRA